MSKEIATLIELFWIEMAYARAEVALAEQPSETLKRVSSHLEKMDGYLKALREATNRADIAPDRNGTTNA